MYNPMAPAKLHSSQQRDYIQHVRNCAITALKVFHKAAATLQHNAAIICSPHKMVLTASRLKMQSKMLFSVKMCTNLLSAFGRIRSIRV